MNGEINWGPEIAVEGKRPEWLRGRTPIQWASEDGAPDWSVGSDSVMAEPAEAEWFWYDITAIRLPAEHPHYATQAMRQDNQRMSKMLDGIQPVDWSQPIEAVHEDGRTRGVYLGGEDKNPDNQGDYYTLPAFDGSTTPDVWKADGATWFGCHPGWRIRNVATPPADARTAPNGGEVGPEVVERMIALVRRLSGGFYLHCVNDTGIGTAEAVIEAQQILALLPEPVDADLDVLVVRKIMHAQQRAMTPPDSGWGNMSYAKGSYDDTPQFQAALAAYRALEKEAGR